MTESLKTLMDRAADAPFAAVDLDAVVTAGERTARRRRGLVAGSTAGVLAITALGIGLAATLGGTGTTQDRVAGSDQAPPLDAATWTWAGRLHTPQDSWSVGHDVASYVRTSEGYAFADPDGAVYSYLDGDVERIGRVLEKDLRLVSDSEGSLVGWIRSEAGRPQFVVHDLATGQQRTFGQTAPGQETLADTDDPAYFYAIDGRTAYVRDARGAVAVDVDTDATRVVDPQARNGFSIHGVEDGLIAFGGEDGDLRVGRSRDQAVPMTGGWSNVTAFSPDARYLSIDADEPMVFDVATGRRVAVDVDGREFATGFEWLGPTTLVVLARRDVEDSPFELLTCEVPAGTCTQVVADLGIGTPEEAENRVAFATGTPAR